MKLTKPTIVFIVAIFFLATGAALLIFSFNPNYQTLPNWNYWSMNTVVQSNETKRTGIGFISRNNVIVIKLDILTSYAEPSKISFHIEDSQGRTVLSTTEVDVTGTFTFKAPYDDYYYLVLDNTPETLHYPDYNYDKTVLSQINYKGESDLILFIPGIILLIIGFVFLARALAPLIQVEIKLEDANTYPNQQ